MENNNELPVDEKIVAVLYHASIPFFSRGHLLDFFGDSIEHRLIDQAIMNMYSGNLIAAASPGRYRVTSELAAAYERFINAPEYAELGQQFRLRVD